MKNLRYLILILIISFLCISCEHNFSPTETLFYTPYGTISVDDDTYQTAYLLDIPNEELYFLAFIHKVDNQEKLISINISEDKSKLFIHKGNKDWNETPVSKGLYAFDLINPQDNVYVFSNSIDHALQPIYENYSPYIIDVSISNDSITYTKNSGTQKTILFDSL